MRIRDGSSDVCSSDLSYGEALHSVPDRVRAQGWKGPLLITEMGPLGPWGAPRTAWGAPIEPTSGEKAVLLARAFAALKGKTQGEIVFSWGQKQEEIGQGAVKGKSVIERLGQGG